MQHKLEHQRLSLTIAKSWGVSVVLILVSLLVVACGDNATATTGLAGSGSSFAAPAFANWQLQFNHQFPDMRVNYQSVGSGQGRSDFLAAKTDFGASDVPITAEEAQAAKKNLADIIQLPVLLGSIVLGFSLGEVKELNFSPQTVCGIYTGQITHWNDPALQSDNPGVTLPSTSIMLMVRSDKSGTTEVFTQYLSAICPAFKDKIGVSGLPDWKKVGVEVNASPQNAGVAHDVSLLDGALGYVEQDYALQYNLGSAKLKNGAGKFVKASKESITSAIGEPTDLNLNLLNRPGDNTYPIVTTSYLLLNRNYQDKAKGQGLVKFAQYILHDGQQDIKTYAYIPLPPPIAKLAQARLKELQAGGQVVLK